MLLEVLATVVMTKRGFSPPLLSVAIEIDHAGSISKPSTMRVAEGRLRRLSLVSGGVGLFAGP